MPELALIDRRPQDKHDADEPDHRNAGEYPISRPAPLQAEAAEQEHRQPER